FPSMTVNGSNRTVNIIQKDPGWTNQTYYFKAGSYCQDNSGTSSEGARVAFSQIDVRHSGTVGEPPTISPQPSDLGVDARETASFAVTAAGTPVLRYQWRKDGADLPGMINPTLSITNAQTSDTGGYSVVVTNAVGSVTSLVARLTVTPPATNRLTMVIEP